MDLWDLKKGISGKRIKGIASKNISELKNLEGKQITIDYSTGKVYDGALDVVQKRPTMRTFDWVKEAPKVPEKNAVCESANDVYRSLEIHPMVYLAYRDNKLNAYEKSFFEHCNLLFDEAQKVAETPILTKKVYLLKLFKNKIAKENGSHVKFFEEVLKDIENGRNF
jgi:hypothetical protein